MKSVQAGFTGQKFLLVFTEKSNSRGNIMKATSPLILLIGLLFLSACGNPDTAAREPDKQVAVRLLAAERSHRNETLRFIGTVEADLETKLSFKFGGKIRALRFDDNDPVRKGALLAELDTAELLAQREKARESLKKAERDLARMETLRSKNIIALSSSQDARSAAVLASAELKMVEDRLRNARILAPFTGRIREKTGRGPGGGGGRRACGRAHTHGPRCREDHRGGSRSREGEAGPGSVRPRGHLPGEGVQRAHPLGGHIGRSPLPRLPGGGPGSQSRRGPSSRPDRPGDPGEHGPRAGRIPPPGQHSRFSARPRTSTRSKGRRPSAARCESAGFWKGTSRSSTA